MTAPPMPFHEKVAIGAILALSGAAALLVVAGVGYLGYTFYAGNITKKAVLASGYYQDCVADIESKTYRRVNAPIITTICSHATLGNYERMKYTHVNTIKNGLVDPDHAEYMETRYFNKSYRQIGPAGPAWDPLRFRFPPKPPADRLDNP